MLGAPAARHHAGDDPPPRASRRPGLPHLEAASQARLLDHDQTVAADNTFWVDPRTGVVIDIEQRVLSVLRGPGGQGKLVVADMDLKMSGSSTRQLAALASKNAASITMLRQTGPLACGVLGLVLLAATIPFRRHWRVAIRRRPPDVSA